MKAQELRIRNIVEWNRHFLVVRSINQDYIESDLWSKPINELYGVPLTEEILFDWFGFNKSKLVGYDYKFYNGFFIKYFRVIFYPDGCKVSFGGSIIDIEIKYFHQLQNLYFALTGEELEVKLPTE